MYAKENITKCLKRYNFLNSLLIDYSIVNQYVFTSQHAIIQQNREMYL